jgi:hypothetical protein
VLTVLLFACTPEFDETRKDLDGFRLVAMAADSAEPRALVWSGEGAWHSTAPTLTWTLDAEPDTFTAALHVENAAGDAEDGVLVVDTEATIPVVTSFTRTVDGSHASLALEGPDDAHFTRWMGTSGTFTETGPLSADWDADEDGTATLVALTIDGHGGNTWTLLDVMTGDPTPALAVGGRLLPVDTITAGSGWYLATLTAADTLAGYLLTDVVAAEDGTGGDVVCGLDPFDVDALADGRCGRDEAEGARVALYGEGLP